MNKALYQARLRNWLAQGSKKCGRCRGAVLLDPRTQEQVHLEDGIDHRPE